MRLGNSGVFKGLAMSVLTASLVVACQTGPDTRGPDIAAPRPQQPPRQDPNLPPEYDPEKYVTTEALDGKEPVRVALLLPFTASSKNVETVAKAMSNAAQLAAFESGNERFLLIPKDTGGTAEGARAKAEEALREGAEIILGPLFSESVSAAATVTRQAGVPMIAFSSDMKIAGDGVYLLSFPPEMEIARVTDFATKRGYTRFGVLAPQSDYGSRVSNSFTEETFVRGGVVVHQETYEQVPDAMLQPAKRLANYAQDCSSAKTPRVGNPNPFVNDFDMDVSLQAGTGFQAVLVPEQGRLLRALAPLLPYYDVNVKCIKLLGVSAWNNPRLTREPALVGGWFAAPDPSLSAGFKGRYEGVYGEVPPRLASLAYDAVLLTARLAVNARSDRFTARNIADPNGYLGADGLFRLTPLGTVERGLAIREIRPSGIKTIDPAPRSFVIEEREFSGDGS